MSFLRYVLFLLLFVVIDGPSQALAQTTFASKAELEKAANDLFQSKEYSKAKSLFSQLLSQEAMNPDYNYRFGVCIMFTEADPAKPLPYIEGGANSAGVNPEAYYFLGLVYRFNYRFDQSAEAFTKAKTKGFSSPTIDLEREAQISRNGAVLFNDAVAFKPAMEKEVIKTEFYRPYDFRKLKGKVIPTPPNFKTKYDEKALIETYIYTPTEATTLVYASLGEDGANGKDLYRVNKLPTGEYALPQRLPDVINTKYDEDYAFWDEVNSILYFSSKGHNTMGGYDVFSSRLDAASGKWSIPVNLQHPVNSPFDDFLYLSDPDNEMAFFTSTRNTSEGMVKVYKTLFVNPDQIELTVVDGRFDDTTDSLYNFMEATVTDPETKEVVGKYRSHALSGKYLLILPPKVGYTMDVAPRGAAGFRFPVDIPKQDPYQTLKQGISYSKTPQDGSVQLTNYFDKAGKLDTVNMVQTKPLEQIKEKMPDLSAEQLALAKAQEGALKAAEVKAAQQLAKEEAAKKVEEEKVLAAQIIEEERKLAEERAKTEAALAAQRIEDERKQAEEKAEAAEQEKILAAQKAETEKKLAEEKAKATEQEMILATQKAEAEKKLAEEKAKAALEQEKVQASKQIEEQNRSAAEKAQATGDKEKALATQKAEAEKKLADEKLLAVQKAEEEQRVAAKKLEEQRKAEELAKAVVLARMDSLKQAKDLALKQAEEKRKAEEKAQAATKTKEQLASEAAEELRVAKEQARMEELERKRKELADKLAGERERNRLDSLHLAQLNSQIAVVQSEEKAGIKAQETLTEQDARLRDEQKKAFLALKESQKKKEQEEQELAETKRLAEEERIQAASQPVEVAPVLQPVPDAVAAEEIAKAKEAITKEAEKKPLDAKALELAELERKAELEKQKKIQADLDKELRRARMELKLAQEKEAEEKAAQEAIRVAAIAKERTRLDSLAEVEAKRLAAAPIKEVATEKKPEVKKEVIPVPSDVKAVPETVIVTSKNDSLVKKEVEQPSVAQVKPEAITPTPMGIVPKDIVDEAQPTTQDTTQAASDAEIFRQTVARIEAQRKAKEAEVKRKAELEAAARAKAEQEREIAQREAKEKAMTEAKASGDTVKVKELEVAEETAKKASLAAADTSKRTPALNSTANPNAYVTDMVDAERKIAADKQKHAEKDYTLKPMPEISAPNPAGLHNATPMNFGEDKALQVSIEEDRRVVNEYQAKAKEQELKLKEKMEQDRQALGLNDAQLAEELRKAEEAALAKQKESAPVVQPRPGATQMVTKGAGVKAPADGGNQPEKAPEMTVAKEEPKLVKLPVVEQANPQSQAVPAIKTDTTVGKTATELFLETVARMEAERKLKEQQTAEAAAKPEIAVKEAPVVQQPAPVVVKEESAAQKPEPTAVKEETVAQKSAPAYEKAEQTQVKHDMSGRPAAMRDYTKRKPDFESIEDKDQRAQVQRMAAEDKGRIAVMKQMNNAEATDSKSAEKLAQLQRTKDVLASSPKSKAREEMPSLSFSKDDLRKRKAVDYQILVELTEVGLSETVREALDPLYVAQLDMSVPEVVTGHFVTKADARGEQGLLKGLGFPKTKIVPRINGTPASMADVMNVPFVD